MSIILVAILLSKVLSETIRDENNNVIWTIDNTQCTTGAIDFSENDCDCNENGNENTYDTPCCGLTPLQCSDNGALNDIDGINIVSPSPDGSISNPLKLYPPNGDACAQISPNQISTSSNDVCSLYSKYIALANFGNIPMSYSVAAQMCQNIGTSIATINPYDKNFGATPQTSALRQYIDITKLCLRNSNLQQSNLNFDSCWIGAVAAAGTSSAPCTMWRFVFFCTCFHKYCFCIICG